MGWENRAWRENVLERGKEEMKLAGQPRSSGAPDDYHGGRSGTKRIGRTAASIDAWDRRGQRA